jgi:hypothetical protein
LGNREKGQKRVQSTVETNLEHRHQPNYSCVVAYVFRPCADAPFGDILSLGIFILEKVAIF